MNRGGLAKDIEQVIESGNCSGCGACVQINPEISMVMSNDGFLRPALEISVGREDARQRREFAKVCPGRRVVAPPKGQAARHPSLGPVMHAWEAWASDEQFRFRGSSGGALSALTGWLLETGQIYSVTGASGKTENPRRTVAVDLTTRDEVLRAAGSRYAPVANVAQYRPVDQPVGFIGKPCEAAALRALSRIRNEENPPLIISFFCAGVPSQTATDRLVDRMGVGKSSPLVDLRYRGFGWPGDFYVADEDGNEGRMSYDESWGRVLGPTTQWRCKICPDGIGESADVVAGDYWSADAAGYPIFEDRKGTSVLIARTTRGQEVVEAAVSAGILCVREIDLDDVATVQPLQVERRMTISGRLLGRLLSGRRVPLYRGFGTGRFALSSPYRNLRAAAGTYLRSVKGLKQSESSLGETDG